MLFALAAVIVFIGLFGMIAFTAAIYAMPILAGLAGFSLLRNIGLPNAAAIPGAAAVALISLVAIGRAANARHPVLRGAALLAIVLPAAYAGFAITMQLAALVGIPGIWRAVVSTAAAVPIGLIARDSVGRPGYVAGWVGPGPYALAHISLISAKAYIES